MTSLKMTVRDDCAVSACSPLPTTHTHTHTRTHSVKALTLYCVGGVSLRTDICHPAPHTQPPQHPGPLHPDPLWHPNLVYTLDPPINPHTLTCMPTPSSRVRPSWPRPADPEVSWSQTHLLIAPLPVGLPGGKLQVPGPSWGGCHWPAGAPSSWIRLGLITMPGCFGCEGKTAGVPPSPGHLGWGHPTANCPHAPSPDTNTRYLHPL